MLLEAGITHRLYAAGALELESRKQMIKENESTVFLNIIMILPPIFFQLERN